MSTLRPATFSGELDALAPLLAVVGPTQPISDRGIPLGTNSYAQPVYLDPAHLHHAGLTNASLYLILGQFQSGKTALIKLISAMLGLLQSQDGRPMRIATDSSRRNDGHSEWESLAELYDATQINLVSQPVNPLDPKMGLTLEQLESLMGDLAAHYWPGYYANIEARTAMSAGLARLALCGPENQHLATLIRVLGQTESLRPVISGTDTPLPIDAKSFEAACRYLAQALDQAMRLFGSQQSIAKLMSQPFVSYDFSGMDDITLGLVQTVFWHWRAAAQTRKDAELMVNLTISDESYRAWRVESWRRGLYYYAKNVRGDGGTVILSTQALADYAATGSLEAVNLLTQIPNVFVGTQSRQDAEETVRFLGLDDFWVAIIQQLHQGQFVMRLGGHSPEIVNVYLTPDMRRLTESNQATQAIIGDQGEPCVPKSVWWQLPPR